MFIPLAGVLLILGAGCSARPAAEQTDSNNTVSEQAAIENTAEADAPQTEENTDANNTPDTISVFKDQLVEIKTPKVTEEGTPPAEPKTEKEEAPPEMPQPPAVPEPIVISITAKQWEFIPSTITVKKEQKVTLNITSTDVDHGFGLSAFGITETLVAGLTTSVVFTPDKTGTFSFFCSVFCGAGHGGMKGTLVVTE